MQKVTYKYLREFVTTKNKTSLTRQDPAALVFFDNGRGVDWPGFGQLAADLGLGGS